MSMLGTWMVRISPETASPGGRMTLVPKLWIVLVIRQTMAKPTAQLNAIGDSISAGLLLPYSRLVLGSESVQISSP